MRSNVSGNHVNSSQGISYGGGAFASDWLEVQSSTVAANSATGSNNSSPSGLGGGLLTLGTVAIGFSAITGNYASYNVGGIAISGGGQNTANIGNSTISGNAAGIYIGGIYTNTPLELDNSTIAFNTAGFSTLSGAPVAAGLRAKSTPIALQSSIIAQNHSPAPSYDVDTNNTIAGSNNLVGTTTVTVPGILGGDPRLLPLAYNGGLTMTHELDAGSAAIGNGSSPIPYSFDQRGVGFPRAAANGAVDIGAVQHVDDPIFNDGFDGAP